ncbi:putative heavy-metal-binding domain-containing protein [Trichoderma austrokoningii]
MFSRGKEQQKPQEVADIPPHLTDLHCFTETEGVVTTTMMDLPGYRIEQVLGTVYGITVRSRNIGASLGMAFKSMAGGELRWFTSMLYSCRNDSIGRVVEECKKRGGNAIICLRFDAGDMGGFAQTAAYGTACRVVKIDDSTQSPPQLQAAT